MAQEGLLSDAAQDRSEDGREERAVNQDVLAAEAMLSYAIEKHRSRTLHQLLEDKGDHQVGVSGERKGQMELGRPIMPLVSEASLSLRCVKLWCGSDPHESKEEKASTPTCIDGLRGIHRLCD